MALTLTCPICGKRNGYEFRYGGEDKGPRPDEEGLTPADWCNYVHMNTVSNLEVVHGEDSK
jgi:sarcosine oxidase subunit delta